MPLLTIKEYFEILSKPDKGKEKRKLARELLKKATSNKE